MRTQTLGPRYEATDFARGIDQCRERGSLFVRKSDTFFEGDRGKDSERVPQHEDMSTAGGQAGRCGRTKEVGGKGAGGVRK